jgi:acetyl-CoA C-acetyltransferase
MPVTQYSVIDNALRYADGQDVAAHRDAVAALWAGFSRVAAENPRAWNRAAIAADEIRGAGDSNRMLAFPYTKRHTSQWNVDQAAGLILCSAKTARALGIAEDRWVYPHAVADANHMLALCERAELHRSPGFAAAGRSALRHAGIDVAEIDHLELYSCFPAAVRVQERELGIPADRPLTLTGGMSFAGGPLNNFVLQAMCGMVTVLRENPHGSGLATAVSGIITKQGVSVWSCRPPRDGFRFMNVSEEARRETEVVDVIGDGEGSGTIASYTILYESGEPSRAVALCDLENGGRTVAKVGDSGFSVAASEEELCGRRVSVRKGVCDL